jgi:hypothetical protein
MCKIQRACSIRLTQQDALPPSREDVSCSLCRPAAAEEDVAAPHLTLVAPALITLEHLHSAAPVYGGSLHHQQAPSPADRGNSKETIKMDSSIFEFLCFAFSEINSKQLMFNFNA